MAKGGRWKQAIRERVFNTGFGSVGILSKVVEIKRVGWSLDSAVRLLQG
jgi:hypothetical protein